MTISDLSASLPDYLAERVRPLNDHGLHPDGAFVLYWMHHAMRAHENPALDVAVSVGNALGLPVLVYQGLAGRHRFNADRHHTFILEGARDVAAELADRDLRHAFFLGRDPSEASPLPDLASRAALVVAEDFPAPPFPRWARRLAETTDAPVWAVDACCVVPMQLLGESFERAYQFRKKAKPFFEERVGRAWDDVEPTVPAFGGDLGFAPIDLATADLAQLCAECEIDHAIGPVPHTPGGSRAGYARWEAFKTHGLEGYARRRNDAAEDWPEGVSRLSPYLHYGMVSPFTLMREAWARDGKGPEKYLDELFVWRELAHNFCFYRDDVEALSALPGWAQDTLRAHADDAREAVYAWETLARGTTGEPLWDAAQRSLLIHGELHNNVRMTWGKALLGWTETPEDALAMLIDLNHRYALDGNDPNSYGGLLWCLGSFDRPFTPEKPVFGTVRPRSVAAHARRLDLDKYIAKTTGPARGDGLRIAVIGAGLAGLFAARTLADHGLAVQVFDKGRGPGGRMSRRRQEAHHFDHGAQYFTARDARFRRYVAAWQAEGLVAPWDLRLAVLDGGTLTEKSTDEPRFVGVPGMNALAKHLAQDVDVRFETRVEHLARDGAHWHLTGEADTGLGTFDVVLVTTPPEQAVPLLSEAPALADRAATVRMRPCWAVMAAFAQPLGLGFDGAFVQGSPLSWVARNTAKPGRPEGEAWVLHASPEWSEAHLEADVGTVAGRLLAAFGEATGRADLASASATAHRWRYALAAAPLDVGCLWDAGLRLGVGGDWCHGSRVEGAFLSGMALAGRVLGLPDPSRKGHAPAVQAKLFG